MRPVFLSLSLSVARADPLTLGSVPSQAHPPHPQVLPALPHHLDPEQHHELLLPGDARAQDLPLRLHDGASSASQPVERSLARAPS